MRNKQVDDLLLNAAEALRISGIVQTDKNQNEYINPEFRGQISTFASAVANGSLLSAIAFFSDRGKAKVDKTKLLDAINTLIDPMKSNGSLFDKAKQPAENLLKRNELKEKVLACAIALKLAMNLFDLESKEVKTK